jgi:hypothetical protein
MPISGVRQTRKMNERLRPELDNPIMKADRKLYHRGLQPKCSIYECTIHASSAPQKGIKR